MFQSVSKGILKLLGWKILGRFPYELKKFIIIAMPHTSNWDLPLGVMVRAALGFRSDFVAKHSIFRPPFGGFFRWLGGHPVDRSKSHGYVGELVALFNREESLVIAMAPEGTRKKVEKIKTGFYHVALAAGIPILMARLDYTRREVTFSEPFWPTGDKEADFNQILDFFKTARGKNPELGIDEHTKF